MNYFQSPIKQAEIVELETGRVIVTYPIDVPSQNSPQAHWEMMERAWHYAVEDGITRNDARWKFSVRIVPVDSSAGRAKATNKHNKIWSDSE